MMFGKRLSAMTMGRAIWVTLALLPQSLLLMGAGTDCEPDNPSYSLINPAPPSSRRPLNSSRPDSAESAQTMDGGVWQAEVSVLSVRDLISDRSSYRNAAADPFLANTYALGNSDRSIEYSLAATTLRVGLLSDLELQLALVPHRSDGVAFDPLRVSLKKNLLGNDGGAMALAVLTGVQYTRDGECTLCFKAPFLALASTFNLGSSVSLSAQLAVVDASPWPLGNEPWWFETELQSALVLSYRLGKRLNIHAEYVALWHEYWESHGLAADPQRVGFFRQANTGVGILYAVDDNTAVDVGLVHSLPEIPYLGTQPGLYDANDSTFRPLPSFEVSYREVFVGLTRRF